MWRLSSAGCGGCYLNGAVVVAVTLVHVVEVTSHEVIRMVAVGNSFMPASRTVLMSVVMAGAGGSGVALRWILGIHCELVLVDVIAMNVVHVSIVKEALVSIVHESGVTAFVPMLMRVSLMDFMSHSGPPLNCDAGHFALVAKKVEEAAEVRWVNGAWKCGEEHGSRQSDARPPPNISSIYDFFPAMAACDRRGFNQGSEFGTTSLAEVA